MSVLAVAATAAVSAAANPAASLAIGVLANTIEQLARAREANELLNGLGHGDDPAVLELRNLVRAQWEISAGAFEMSIEGELAEREHKEQQG